MPFVEPNTNITLYKDIPFDIHQKYTVDFPGLTAQQEYFADIPAVNKKEYRAYSFVKSNGDTHTITVGGKYGDIFNYNYMSFINSSHENKMFYAFILDVEYENENVCNITYRIDYLQSYMFDYEVGECFVEREHHPTDEIGASITTESVDITRWEKKEYIMPTSLRREFAEVFILSPEQSILDNLNGYVGEDIKVEALAKDGLYFYDPSIKDGGFFVKSDKLTKNPDPSIAGLYSPFFIFFGSKTLNNLGSTAKDFISNFSSYLVASYIIEGTMFTRLIQPNIIEGSLERESSGETATYTIHLIKNIGEYSASDIEGVGVLINTVNGATPITNFIEAPNGFKYNWGDMINDYPLYAGRKVNNNKIYNSPYSYYEICTGDISKKINLQYITSYTDGGLYFRYAPYPIPTLQIIPKSYLSDPQLYNFSEKCEYYYNNYNTVNVDSLKQFLLTKGEALQISADSAKNVASIKMVGSLLGTAGASAVLSTVNPVLAGANLLSGGTQALTTFAGTEKQIEGEVKATLSKAEHSIDTAVGITQNLSSISFAYSEYIRIRLCTPIEQELEILDDYFTKYGYNVSDVKQPNTRSRKLWNYVKTNGCILRGINNNGIPTIAEETLKNIYNDGITFYHDANAIGKMSTLASENTPVTA